MKLIVANFAQGVEGAPEEIVFLPEGRHQITASVNGQPETVDVVVAESLAAVFQQELEDRHAQNVRPNLDFDHKNEVASAIPKSFRYQKGKGLMLALDWSRAGREAIEGRDYSYFSPSFMMDDDGTPSGLPASGPIGGLVNDPAFREIPKIAAKAEPTKTKKTMQNTTLVEAGLLNADEAAKEDAVALAKKRVAAFRKDAEHIEAAQKKVEAAEARATKAEEALEVLQGEITKAEDERIAGIVAKAVEDGQIGAKDEKKQAKVTAMLKADEELGMDYLAALEKTNVTTKFITGKGSGGDRKGEPLKDLQDVLAKARAEGKKGAEIRKVIAAHNAAGRDEYAAYRASLNLGPAAQA